MRRLSSSLLSCAFPLAALALTAGCTSSFSVGSDGQGGTGGHATTSTSAGQGGTGATTTGTTTGATTGTTTGAGGGGGTGGAGGACGWDGNPVSLARGPCGGNLWAHPPTCAPGLTCVTKNPDAVGTCATDFTTVSGEGEPCGGPSAAICAWNLECNAPPGGVGTCVPCSQGTGGAGGSGTGGAGGSGTGGSGAGGGCSGATFTVEGDGATKELDYACAGSYGAPYTNDAFAYVGVPAPHWMGPEQLWVEGCATSMGAPMAGSLSLQAPQAMLGTSQTGSAHYFDGVDAYATTSDVQLTVTELENQTGTVRGSYTATVSSVNNGVKTLSGSFRVCAVMGFFPP